MWEMPQQKIALLELLVRGTLKRRLAQAEAYDMLAGLPWTRATRRRDCIALAETRRDEVVRLLERVWPDWETAWTELRGAGLPPTPDGWKRLEDARRADHIPALPRRLNRRTALALAGPHSKARLTPRRRAALDGTQTTHDGLLRLRPPQGLLARTATDTLDLWELARSLGEAPIPERAFLDGLKLEGPLHAVLLVENLGAWRDLPTLEGWLIAHVPGWDVTTVMHLLDQIKPDIPVVHFGDLDPNGVRIFLKLRKRRPALKWFIPGFWMECAAPRPLKHPWPARLVLGEVPPLVRNLARQRLWLEQEPLVVDGRISAALRNCAGQG